MKTLMDIAYLIIMVIVLYSAIRFTLNVVMIPYNTIKSGNEVRNVVKQTVISAVVAVALILFLAWLHPLDGIIRGLNSITDLLNGRLKIAGL